MSRQVIQNIDLPELLGRLKEEVFTKLNCFRVGRIERFYPETQLADISLVDKKIFETDLPSNRFLYEDFALLAECPVVICRGNKGGITIPINSGDNCLVAFNDRDYSAWLTSGGKQAPSSRRTHALSDAIAIVGLFHLQNSISNYNPDATEINYLNTLISLDGKVKIANNMHSLKDLVDELIDAILALQVVLSPTTNLSITTATTTALDLVKTKFDELLKS